MVYIPLMNTYFTTAPLGVGDWAFLLSLAVVVVLAEEIRKFFSRRFTKTGPDTLKIHDHT
jgi:hypothetical protein